MPIKNKNKIKTVIVNKWKLVEHVIYFIISLNRKRKLNRIVLNVSLLYFD